MATPNLHATKLEVYHIEMQGGGGLIDCCKINKGYQDSLGVIATKLRTGRRRSQGQILFYLQCPHSPWELPSPLPSDVNLTTIHFHVMSVLRICGGITPFSTIFKEWYLIKYRTYLRCKFNYLGQSGI